MPRSDLEDEEDYQHKEIQEEELPSNQKRELLLALEVKKVKLTPFLNARDHHVEKGGGLNKGAQKDYWPERTHPNQRNKLGSYHLYIRGAAHFTDQLVIVYFAIRFLNFLAVYLFVQNFFCH